VYNDTAMMAEDRRLEFQKAVDRAKYMKIGADRFSKFELMYKQ